MPESEFKILYDKYFRGVYGYIYARVAQREEAEDIVAEVFLAVWRLRDQLDGQRNPGSLIYTIARNKLCDHLRKHYKLDFLTLDADLLATPENDDDEPVANNQLQLIQMVERSLDSLGEQYQQLFQLKYRQNKTYPQIAAEMKISEGNAKVINNRLIKKLKTLCNKTES